MDVNEPRLRRRGFFHHSETGEPDTGEHENPEGFIVRVGFRRSLASSKVTRAAAHTTLSDSRLSGGRQSRAETSAAMIENGRLRIRSESATDSRQRAHSTR
jgi:hypothetical protein